MTKANNMKKYHNRLGLVTIISSDEKITTVLLADGTEKRLMTPSMILQDEPFCAIEAAEKIARSERIIIQDAKKDAKKTAKRKSEKAQLANYIPMDKNDFLEERQRAAYNSISW